MKFKILAVASLFCISSAGFAHNHKAGDGIQYSSSEIAKNLYMLKGEGGFTGGNIVVLSGDDGVVMIDDGMPKFLDHLNKKIKQVVGKPVDYIINTHLHGDHTGNNAAFAKTGSHIIAHDNVRSKMKIKDGDASKSLPVFTFNDRFTSHLNNQRLQAIHAFNAHTDGDVFVYFPDANVIHTGDIFFNGMFPFIDLNNGGSVKGYIAAQTAILSVADANTKIVPGHGPLATKADLQTALDMLLDAKKKVQALLDEGFTKAQVVKANPLKSYHEKWNWNFITTEKMTETLYQSLAATTDTMKTHHNH